MPVYPLIRKRTSNLRSAREPVYNLLGVHKLTTSTYHPRGTNCIGRVNQTMRHTLIIVCNEHQNDRDVLLPHAEYTYNNPVSATVGLYNTLNEIHIGHLPRLPFTTFDRSYGGAHRSFKRDQLAYCDHATVSANNAFTNVCKNNTC